YFGDPGDGNARANRPVPVKIRCPECKQSTGPATPNCEASPAGPICDVGGDWTCGECGIDSDCDGATPRCDRGPLHHVCVACNGDFGSTASFACLFGDEPICHMGDAMAGRCTVCAPGKAAACTNPTKPACEATTGTCAPCNGDFGAAGSAVCPTSAAPACRLGECVALATLVTPADG